MSALWSGCKENGTDLVLRCLEPEARPDLRSSSGVDGVAFETSSIEALGVGVHVVGSLGVGVGLGATDPLTLSRRRRLCHILPVPAQIKAPTYPISKASLTPQE